MWKTRTLAAAIVLVAVCTIASAAIDVAVKNGDTITSSVASGGDVAVFRADVPGGSTLNVTAKASKNGVPLDVRVVQDDGTELARGPGTTVALASIDVRESGGVRIEVKAQNGASTGAFTLTLSWTTLPTSFTDVGAHAANSWFTVPFSAPAGAEATFTTGPAPGAATRPSLIGVMDTAHVKSLPLLSGSSATQTIPATDDWLLFVNTGPRAGEVATTIRLDYPGRRNRKMRLAASDAPAGVTARVAAPFTKAKAGRLDGTGPIAGSSVDVPKGALKRSGTLFLGDPGAAGAFPPPDSGLTVAGGPVYVGFVGTAVAPKKSITVTVPLAANVANVRVYRRNADGSTSRLALVAVSADSASAATDRGGTFAAFDASALAGESRTLSAGDVRASEFGRSVAADEDTLLVGTSLHSPSQGAVHVYSKDGDGWSFAQSLTASDGTPDDDFGRSIALDGDTIVVGAPGSLSTAGAAYVFTRSGGVWTEAAKLVSDQYGFGWSVALDQGTLVVGAPAGDRVDVFVGAAATWKRTDALRGVGNSMFGYAVAIQAKTIVVGAWLEGDGAVHVYHKSASHWRQAAKFADEPGSYADESLGFSVAVDGDVIASGAAFHSHETPGAGAVNVYRRRAGGKWAFSQRVTPSDGGPHLGFGGSLALRDSLLVVASYDQVSTTPEAVHAYRVGAASVSLIEKHQPRQFVFGFGRTLALAGGTLFVGAPSGADAPLFLFDVAGF